MLTGLAALFRNQGNEPVTDHADAMCGLGYLLEGISAEVKRIYLALDEAALEDGKRRRSDAAKNDSEGVGNVSRLETIRSSGNASPPDS